MSNRLTIVMLFTGALAQAQYISQQGRFQVDQVKGCAPFTITLTNLQAGSCTTGSPCAMDYQGNGQTQQNIFSFTYNTPGTYSLSVLYQNTGADKINITVDQNISPAFEIYTCAGTGASIKILDNNYDQYVIDFNGDGVPENVIPNSNNKVASFNYGSAGVKSISVRGRDLNSADNCSSNVQTFTALNALPAASFTSLTLQDDSHLQLDFNLIPNVQHHLEIAVNNSTNFQLLQTLYQVGTYQVPNLQTQQSFYCFRLSSYDPCNNTNVYSNTICSNKLSLNIQSAVNKLSWATATTGIQSVSILRNGGAYVTIPGAPTSFDDVDIECKTEYCYQIVTNYTNGAKSLSFERCGTSFTNNTPTQINNISSVVSDNGVQLTWIQDPPDQPAAYRVFRSSDKQNFSQLATVNEKALNDLTFSLGSPYCYRINYKDKCDNESPEGAIVCPTQLMGSMDNQNVITLNWSRYVGWNAGVKNYLVEKYDKTGSLIKTFNTGTDTTLIDNEDDPKHQMISYRVRVVANQSGVSPSISNTLTFTKDNHIFFPTAFSPNGDNLNDRFSVSGQFIVSIELSIFNRWGELVYSSTNNEPWDGTFEGSQAQEDAYVWSANITDLAGRTFKRSGTVALLRRKK